MKKRRSVYLKIVLAAFIIILMSAACIGISAEGDSSAELKIAYCNLSFESDTHIMYAIKSDNANVKLLVWSEAQSEYLLGSETAAVAPLDSQMNINGAPYTVFKYTGLAAKQMTDDVYVRACIDNGNGDVTYGEVHKYSILQYAYNKLGKTGTATTNEKLIKMLENMLAYGASAQEYHGYKTDRLATAEFVQVKLDDGSLPDGFKSGLYLEGEKITITAPMQNMDGVAFSHWEDELGNIIGSPTSDYTLTVGQENIKYIPNYINCSAGLKLTSNGDGTCYVAGIGSCTDTDLVIPYVSPDGDVVTKICDKAFNYSTLTSVIIPNSVTNISDDAFSYCSSLKSVTIGNSVTSIGDRAFYYCSSLESIIVPDSVTNIGQYAFYNCSSLKSVTIGNSVTNIGGWAFKGCTSLIQKENGVSYVDKWVVDADNSIYVTLRNNTVGIADYVFNDCTNLKRINIPDSVKNIGDYTFQDCSSLESITIHDSVESIGCSAFSGCENLESIVVSAKNTVYKSVGNCLIEIRTKRLVLGCKNSVIPADGSVKKIGDYAFYHCSSLESITIPDSVESIGEWAFSNCTSLENITISDSVKSIGELAFSNCTSLENITIPDSVESIGELAFYSCTSIESITIPDNVESIGECAFSNCTNLESITVNAKNTIYKSVGNCIIEIRTKTLVLGCKNSVIPTDGSVTNIGDRAFYSCRSLESITIPDSVISIGYMAFFDCSSLKSITLPFVGATKGGTSNTNFGYIFGASNDSVPKSLKNIIITGGTNIDSHAFYKCSSLESIIIPDSVTSIGYGAFSECSSLQNITIPDSVTWLASNVFYKCSNLESVTIGNNIKDIRENMFYQCISLKSITIGNSVTRIADSAFYKCSSLESIIIPDSVTSIGCRAFSGCTSLESITIPNNVTRIGYYAFEYCTSLTSIILNDSNVWYRTTNPYIGGTETDVTDASNNATYFTNTYRNYYWYKV